MRKEIDDHAQGVEGRRDIPHIPGVRDLSEIGRGGFATVYRGTQLKFDRQVAVKVFDATAWDSAALKQFESECKALGRLQGLHVVQVHDSGLVPGSSRPYLVMELCGGSLHDRVAVGGRLAPAEVAEIGHRIAMALDGAHREGLLHRDVTPRNILFTTNGKAVLADFGLAIHTDAPSRRQDNATWSYAAPETWNGEPSAGSDVYGLGASLYYALTGKIAFARRPGETEVAWQHRILVDPAPTARGGGVPQEFVETVDRMMGKTAEVRPQPSEVALSLAAHGAAPAPLPRTPRPAGAPDPSALETGWRPDAVASAADITPVQEDTRLRPGSTKAVTASRKVGKPVMAGVAVLVLLAGAGAAVALWPTSNSGETALRPSTSVGATTAAEPPKITFGQPVDDGTTARLTWRGTTDLDYAVVIAVEGSPKPETVLVKRNTSYDAKIDPKLRYCFVVQGSDGEHTVESEPRNIRGGRCRALGSSATAGG